MAKADSSRDRGSMFSPYVLIAPVLMVVALILFERTDFGEKLDFMFRDKLFQMRHDAEGRRADSQLLFVGIDDVTLKALDKRWPFDRTIHGLWLRGVAREVPGVVGWDVMFSESEPTQDKAFFEDVKAFGSPIVFASSEARVGGGVALPMFIRDATSLLTQPFTQVTGDISLVREIKLGLMPTGPLTEYAQFGFIHDQRDSDGVKRRSFLLHRIGGKLYPNLALQMLLAKHHVASDEVEIELGKEIRIETPSFQRVIPIQNGGEFDVNYRYTVSDVENCSYIKIENRRPLKDKILLIAQMSTGLTDMGPSPLDEYAPFAMMHVNVLANILEDDHMTALRGGSMWLLWAGWLLIAYVTLSGFSRLSYWGAIICPLALAISGFGICYMVFVQQSIVIPYFFPIMGFLGLHVGAVTRRVLEEQKDKQRLKDKISPYVGSGVMDRIMATGVSVVLEGQRRNATVLFTDIREFTLLAERVDEDALISQLNEYFSEMVNCVNRYEGTLHKFIGDAVMAVWGDLSSRGAETDARQAVMAALDMQVALSTLNKEWASRGIPTLRMGAGLNYGNLIAGDIGAPQRKEFTVIGDPVNLASRLEGLTKAFGVETIVGPEVRNMVNDVFICRTLGVVQVVGREQPVEVSEVLGRVDDDGLVDVRAWALSYQSGFEAYKAKRFDEAVNYFELAIRLRPEDYLTDYYLADASDFVDSPPPDDWSCLYTAQTK